MQTAIHYFNLSPIVDCRSRQIPHCNHIQHSQNVMAGSARSNITLTIQ